MSERVLRVAFQAGRRVAGVRDRWLSEVWAAVGAEAGIHFSTTKGDVEVRFEWRTPSSPKADLSRARAMVNERTVVVLASARQAWFVVLPDRSVWPANGDGRIEAMSRVARFLLSARPAAPTAAAWERSSEELIRRLHVLLEQKDRLLAQMAEAYEEDRRAARARIEQLEAQLAALEAERLRTPSRWRDPLVILNIAIVIATVLGPIGGELVADVVAQAQQVQVDCGAPPTTPSSPRPG